MKLLKTDKGTTKVTILTLGIVQEGKVPHDPARRLQYSAHQQCPRRDFRPPFLRWALQRPGNQEGAVLTGECIPHHAETNEYCRAVDDGVRDDVHQSAIVIDGRSPRAEDDDYHHYETLG